MSYFSTVSTKFADSGSIDAFGRMRISNPTPLFDAQFTYNLNPMLFEQVTTGTGASIARDTTNRCAKMDFSSTATGGVALMQTYEYLPYQPGRSQLIDITFNMREGVTNCLKFAGYSDGNNGIEFQLNGTTKQFVLYSDTGKGDETVTQNNWNADKLDGTGVSGITLDITKTQILTIDLQALYVGRVRVGFVINGLFYLAHEFKHSNIIANPYMQTANLPVRCGMTCSGTVTTTMDFICCAVISEGGESTIRGRTFTTEGTFSGATAQTGIITPASTRTHILSIRPGTTFNSIVNRIAFDLDGFSILNNTTNASVRWELAVGATLSGNTAYADVSTTYSGIQVSTGGTATVSSGLVIASGYVGQSSGAGVVGSKIASKYPITLGRAGAVRSLGTLSLLVTSTTGSASGLGSIQWREIR